MTKPKPKKKTEPKPKRGRATKAKDVKGASATVSPPAPATAETKLSALDAAARVLGESGAAMSPKEMIGVMAAKGYWSSPGGKTPANTLYSSIMREVSTKGTASRFKKAGPGRFVLAT